MEDEMELTILMPCLNEERSLARCIGEAWDYLEKSGVSGEILIADNGSTDNSLKVARALGARVVQVLPKGYGSALMGGIQAAKGTYIVMGDCDGSYDFSAAGDFVGKLREGYGLVVGNRYLGGMEPGAMPFLHRCLGVPVLSFLGRWCYGVEIGDFHCGIRGFDRKKAMALGLECRGMEFSTEIIGRFARSGELVCQIPAVLRRDTREGHSHLRTFSDGWRHLRLMMTDGVKYRRRRQGEKKMDQPMRQQKTAKSFDVLVIRPLRTISCTKRQNFGSGLSGLGKRWIDSEKKMERTGGTLAVIDPGGPRHVWDSDCRRFPGDSYHVRCRAGGGRGE